MNIRAGLFALLQGHLQGGGGGRGARPPWGFRGPAGRSHEICAEIHKKARPGGRGPSDHLGLLRKRQIYENAIAKVAMFLQAKSPMSQLMILQDCSIVNKEEQLRREATFTSKRTKE